jgi:hypothetical protein
LGHGPRGDPLRLSDIGVKDNEIFVFFRLMDPKSLFVNSKSLFITANADIVYVVGFLDISNGPTVIETSPKALGTFIICGDGMTP